MSPNTGRASLDAVFRSAERGGFGQVKLKYAGGEPTLALGRVFELDSYARRLSQQTGIGLDSVVLSNGVALSERAIAGLQARGIRLMISLDGLGAVQDAQRHAVDGRGSFEWVSRSLDRLEAAELKPFISVTLSGRTAGGLAEVAAYLLERDLPFNINFYRENERSASHADLQLQAERIIAALREAIAVIETRLPDYPLLGMLIDRARLDHPHERACGAGSTYLAIDAHGRVAKCHMQLDHPVTDVFCNDPLAALRAAPGGVQNLSVDERQECKDCLWRYGCGGGCPLVTYAATGRYDVKSPYCNIYRAIYPELLRLEKLRLARHDHIIL